MIDPKALKKIAKACREAGIKHYKCPEFEFTLTEEEPAPRAKASEKGAAPAANGNSSDFKSDSLSPEDLLYWSVRPVDEDQTGKAGDNQ